MNTTITACFVLALGFPVLGAGAGVSFAPAEGSPIPLKAALWITTADVDSDKTRDLIVASDDSGVSVLLGDGRGGFTAAAGTPLAAPGSHMVVSGDLNGDGHADIASTRHDSHEVHVWLGDGRGRFVQAADSPFRVLDGGKAHNHGLALGDVDGDDDLDLATADDEAHAVPVLLNDGKGRFAPAPASPFAVGEAPYPLALADMNADGQLDILTPNTGHAQGARPSVSVLLGDGKGGFRSASGASVALASGDPSFVATGDVNEDGRLDVLTSDVNGSRINVLLGDGRGGLRPADGSPVDVGRKTWKAELLDMDRDGRLDAVLGGDGAVTVVLGDGRGGFRPALGSPFRVGRGAWTMAVGDFNGDGKADVASADVEDRTITILLQR